jgi:hypothetical protein
MSLASGTRLGSYEVLSLPGAGGMGEVYRARDSRLGRDVAIKVPFADVACDTRARTPVQRTMRRFVGAGGGCVAPAAWLTATDCPATFRVPLREVPVVLAATLNVTEPMPDPLAPAVTVIQGVVVVAVHEQAVPAMTLTVRLLAIASTAKLSGVTVPVQPPVP